MGRSKLARPARLGDISGKRATSRGPTDKDLALGREAYRDFGLRPRATAVCSSKLGAVLGTVSHQLPPDCHHRRMPGDCLKATVCFQVPPDHRPTVLGYSVTLEEL